ncbi:MAG: 5-guanidino-2-oxopentanoate decarboxylase [Desulfotignum sp.]
MQKKTMDNRQDRNRISVGKALVQYLENHGISVVFGIPGVHTLALYRGLEKANIRHVTPRHEQGAGFMADGYARVSGKPGVAFVITGPGITNILTAMGQALADSIPMLVVSSVNAADSLGKGLGHLHELPDQQGLCRKLSLRSEHIHTARDLIPALDAIFTDLAVSRPGPMHIQVPLDLLGQDAVLPMGELEITMPPLPDPKDIAAAREKLAQANRPVIIAGGGSISAADQVTILAETLNAPVVQTINARGQMHRHPLRIPASPSLQAVRHLLAASDAVLAVGTQLGPTDFDIYNRGDAPPLGHLIRVDIDPQQLQRHPADIRLQGQARDILPLLIQGLAPLAETGTWGEHTAKTVCSKARAELPPGYGHMVEMVETIRDALPGSIIVGDSTQPVYAANLYYGHDSPKGWFNAATGFGTLGYAIPAAIGACLADPGRRVVCITGDGGAQFTLPEMMTARDESLPVVFLIWNNFGFKEIADAMADADITPIGCCPRPPDFQDIARAYGMPYVKCHNTVSDLAGTLKSHADSQQPVVIEIQIPYRHS